MNNSRYSPHHLTPNLEFPKVHGRQKLDKRSYDKGYKTGLKIGVKSMSGYRDDLSKAYEIYRRMVTVIEEFETLFTKGD